MSISTDFITISWAISKGRETYGQNICRLDVRSTNDRYKTLGGGYDMIGSVVGTWLQKHYQTRLVEISSRARLHYTRDHTSGSLKNRENKSADALYGMSSYLTPKNKTGNELENTVLINGSCGINSVTAIALSIGVSISSVANRKGHLTGFMVTDYGIREKYQELTNF